MLHKESYTYAYYFLNPKYYQNEIWSNTSALYDRHFWLNAGDGKLVLDPFMILLK